MSLHTYTVVWNGTRTSACGTRYLASEPEAAPQALPQALPQAPRRTGDGHLSVRICAALVARGPSTSREIVDILAVPVDAVHQALCRLRQARKVVIVGSQPYGDQLVARRHVRVYDVAR